tara:strand:+ start:507 stop:695 length:189 start_codon:yes stop_codon:yes gene_type:complete
MANKRTGPDYLDQKPKKKKNKKIAQVIKLPKVSPVQQIRSGKELDQKVKDKKKKYWASIGQA